MSSRPARKADAAAAAARTAAGWTRAQFEDASLDPKYVFLVSEKGHVVGMVVADELQIVDVAVDPSERRRGTGRSLVESIILVANERGCVKATLEVSARNEPALALYRTEGFVVVGRRPKFYNDGSDAVLMDRKIP